MFVHVYVRCDTASVLSGRTARIATWYAICVETVCKMVQPLHSFEVEVVGPLHLSSDGRYLAVVLRGAGGILLCDVGGPCLQPLARLAAGQSEPCTGVTILPGHRILACRAALNARLSFVKAFL